MARMYRGRARRLVLLLVAGVLAHTATALDVVVTRHAETLANVTKVYSSFNQRHFTEAGEKQLAALTDMLREHRFDAILVSPATRVLRTIQPYLEATGQTAEIWPELEECCWQRNRESERTPPGDPILLEPEQRPLFLLRAGAAEVAPGNESYVEGVRRARQLAIDIRKRWGGTNARILVVGHYHTGARLVEALVDDPRAASRLRIDNARLTHLKEMDGRFTLVGLNEEQLHLQPSVPAEEP
ncbi:MAG TPA: histidine phosphatase family protein [Kiritimatiellia bacterium]|nr:histidine phosphatase family protein [Kiritimatiellia bacterium]